MAAQTLSIGSFQDNAAELSVTYDDVSLLLQSVTLRNDGLPFTLTVTLTRPDSSVFFTATRAFGAGTATQNVSAANVLMVIVRGSPHLPFGVQLGGI